MQRPITSKTQMIKMFAQGLFGNNLRTWSCVEDLLEAQEDGLDCKIMVRFRKPDGPVQKDLTPWDAIMITHRLVDSGAWKYEDIYYNEVLEDQDKLVTVQGELMRTHLGLYFMCSSAPMRMREAMRHKDVQHIVGLRVNMMLQHYCDPSSYDTVMDLLDAYPDHIIELTVCSRAVGSLAHLGRNTIVWEVRDY